VIDGSVALDFESAGPKAVLPQANTSNIIRVNPHETQSGQASSAHAIRSQAATIPLSTRLTARLFPSRYDGQLAAGAVPWPNSALDVHARRLVTFAEREAVARSFRQIVQEARKPLTPWTARSWTHRPSVTGAADLIDRVTLHLHSPRPVDPIGMALLRQLLTEGVGPLYSGRSDLRDALRTALAAL
jgi:hypothetical protein